MDIARETSLKGGNFTKEDIQTEDNFQRRSALYKVDTLEGKHLQKAKRSQVHPTRETNTLPQADALQLGSSRNPPSTCDEPKERLRRVLPQVDLLLLNLNYPAKKKTEKKE